MRTSQVVSSPGRLKGKHGLTRWVAGVECIRKEAEEGLESLADKAKGEEWLVRDQHNKKS